MRRSTYTVTVDMPVTPMEPAMMALLLRWLQQFTLTTHQAEHLMVIIRSRIAKEGQ